jgi:hypothetical protein
MPSFPHAFYFDNLEQTKSDKARTAWRHSFPAAGTVTFAVFTEAGLRQK